MPDTPSITVQRILVDQLHPNQWNRKQFDPQQMEELVQSIKSKGVDVSLIVRPLAAGGYEIADGERRWLAAQKAGLKDVPCEVRNLTDEQVAEMDILVNIQREEIPVLEMARMVDKYIKQFNVTQDDAAKKFGKPRTWVTDLIGFLTIHPDIRANVGMPTLGYRALQALKRIPQDQQSQLASELKQGKLKPEGVEKRCNKIRFSGKAKPPTEKVKADENEEHSDDPLSDIWQPLQMQAMTTGKHWGVAYGPWQVPGIGASVNAWHFAVPNISVTPRAEIKRWAQQIMDAMGDIGDEEKRIKTLMTRFAPANEQEAQQMTRDLSNARLPQNPEEQAELDKLSAQGPGAVHGWIYGKDSFYAMKARGMTWQDLGIKDAQAGLQMTISGLAKVAQLDAYQSGPPAKQEDEEEPLDPKIQAMIARQLAKGKLR